MQSNLQFKNKAQNYKFNGGFQSETANTQAEQAKGMDGYGDGIAWRFFKAKKEAAQR